MDNSLPKPNPYLDFTDWKKRQRETAIKSIRPLTVDHSRIIPLTIDDKRIVPLTVDHSRIIPLSADDVLMRNRCVPLNDEWTVMCDQGKKSK